MKIVCSCGASIVDQTDYLPHKGHLIPDQEWFAVFDALDADIIDALASGSVPRVLTPIGWLARSYARPPA